MTKLKKKGWSWKAKLEDGSIVEQPREPVAFLGDLDKAKVVIFIVKRLFVSFSLNLREGKFYRNGKLILDYSSVRSDKKFIAFRRVTITDLSEKKTDIFFGFNTDKGNYQIKLGDGGGYEKIT